MPEVNSWKNIKYIDADVFRYVRLIMTAECTVMVWRMTQGK